MNAPLPLDGVAIVITRPLAQAGELAGKLEALGARVILLPTISLEPPADPAPLDDAILRLSHFDWVIFTSVNGVDGFTDRLEAAQPAPAYHSLPVCAIGPATAARAAQRGWRVELIPEQYVAESLVAAFSSVPLAGKRILLPRAAVARDVVPTELRRRGAEVTVVEVYRTVSPPGLDGEIARVFAAGQKPHWITFTSSSTVKNFAAAAPPETLSGVKVASIGPVTTQTAAACGIPVTVEADPYTLDGLVAAILRCHAPSPSA